jgi:hypothetical protein
MTSTAATVQTIATLLAGYGLTMRGAPGRVVRYVQMSGCAANRPAASAALKALAAQERSARRGAEAMLLELAAYNVQAER